MGSGHSKVCLRGVMKIKKRKIPLGRGSWGSPLPSPGEGRGCLTGKEKGTNDWWKVDEDGGGIPWSYTVENHVEVYHNRGGENYLQPKSEHWSALARV